MNDLLLFNWIICLGIIREILLFVLIILIIIAFVKFIRKM